MNEIKKKKYRVRCGALVTVFRRRTFIVTADSVDEAKEKARDMFRRVGSDSLWEVDSVEIDGIEEV